MTEGTNVVVDTTQREQYLIEIKEIVGVPVPQIQKRIAEGISDEILDQIVDAPVAKAVDENQGVLLSPQERISECVWDTSSLCLSRKLWTKAPKSCN